MTVTVIIPVRQNKELQMKADFVLEKKAYRRFKTHLL